MSDTSSDEVSLPSNNSHGQHLITEYFRGSGDGPQRKRPQRTSEEFQPKRMKTNESVVDNQTTRAIEKKSVDKLSTGDSGGPKKLIFDDGDPIMTSHTKMSTSEFNRKGRIVDPTAPDLKARPRAFDTSHEVKNRKTSAEEWKTAKLRRPIAGITEKFEISSSSDDCNSDSGEKSHSNRTSNMNLEFYRNKVSSSPDGDFIENILKYWKDDFGKLERHHGYIQWLFPIRESGMNSCAQVLHDSEAKTIKETPVLKDRLLRAYKMMLGFYGLRLENDAKGIIGPSSLYKSRIAHLNASFHNNLRITRILKALGELGYEHFKKPLVTFLVNEAFQKKTLVNCRKSCLNFWIPTIEDKKEQEDLEKLTKGIKDYETRRMGKKF